MKRALLAILLAALALPLTASGQQSKPNPERVKADVKRLDQLQKVFASTPEFDDRFMRESRRLADERGSEIIHAIMVHGRTWQGEQGLIFVPLVVMLPRAPTVALLKEYERSKRKSDRHWARELQMELELEADNEIARKYPTTR